MLTFNKFRGINNVQPAQRLTDSEHSVATDVNVGLSAELQRRAGFTEVSPDCHKNLHQADGFLLATIDGDLTAVNGVTRTLVQQSLGSARVWYTNLPDGRTTFSNGLINGMASASGGMSWGIPVPPDVGAATDIPGALFPGTYQYALTYIRLADGLEGTPARALPLQLASGGIFLSGLPVRDGYAIGVYLSSHNGEDGYLAGTTTTGVFSFIGTNNELSLPCATFDLAPPIVGTVSAFWRGRVIVARGNAIFASQPHSYHLFDLRRDFKQFADTVTMIQPVDDGLYIGTTSELAFLSGAEFDALTYERKLDDGVVLGSGVTAPGDMIALGDKTGRDLAMLCIAGGNIVAGFKGGVVSNMTYGRYFTDATEVSATYRTLDGIPQYIAVPQ